MPQRKHSVELKLLQGVADNEVARTTTDLVTAPRREPRVPPNLSVGERKAWDRTTAALREMNLLTDADAVEILHFVRVCALAERLHLELAKLSTLTTTNMETGMTRAHPLLAAYDTMVGRASILGSKLGLSPHARSIIHGRAIARPDTEAANVKDLYA